jgi:hypothetical protein
LLELSDRFGPNVAAYWARLQERDGFRRAQQAQQNGVESAGLVVDRWGAPVHAPAASK